MTQTVRRRENIAIAIPFFRAKIDLIVGTHWTWRLTVIYMLTRTVARAGLYNTIENFVDVASWTPPSLPQVSNLFHNW